MFKLVSVFTSLLAFLVHWNGITCFSITPLHSTISRSAPHSNIHRFMSGDAESEAQRLMEQAKKLREEAASIETTSGSPVPGKTSSSKALYDDEVAPEKDPISSEMRNRLLREASSGLDSEKKQVNVILYISVFISLLVLIGGQGILF